MDYFSVTVSCCKSRAMNILFIICYYSAENKRRSQIGGVTTPRTQKLLTFYNNQNSRGDQLESGKGCLASS